jgi:hypothetical protein
MEKKFFPAIIALLVALSCIFAFAAQEKTYLPKAEIKVKKEKCLECHGPYTKIIEATKSYQASSGETVSPHQYVPHAEKADMPECEECHTAHPIPPATKPEKPKNLDFCYQTCHHAFNLQPCKNCH